MGDDVEVWEYWNSIDSFKLHQGMSLVKGFIPPRDVASLPYEERHDWHHCITTMADYEKDFDRLLQSLRADLEYGAEFRALTNIDAAYHQIPKHVFITHWRKCGYQVHKNLKVQGQGRPEKVDKDEALKIAQEYAAKNADYSLLLKAIMTEYHCAESTARSAVTEKSYAQMKMDYEKPKK
jgi:hypothetical protein